MNFENKVIFVSKKLIMEDGKQYFDNYFASVKSVDEEAIVVIKPDGEEENLPRGEEFYEEAEPGLYELNDGSTHENPDYIADFLIYENDAAYQKYKDQ
ncbi:MAG TPA: hypothetical protein VN030_08715 [Cellvibrio sp.]|nr:hypothetical protein [Cellvibrio sp.]